MFRLDPYLIKMYLLALVAGLSLGAVFFFMLRPLFEELAQKIGQSRVYAFFVTVIRGKDENSDIPLAVRRAMRLKSEAEDLPPVMAAWVNQAEARIKKSGLTVPVGRYLIGIILGIIVGFLVGIVLLNNLAAALVLTLAAVLVPDAVLSSYAQRRQVKIIEQLGVAVRVFSAEFNDTPQVIRALSRTAQRIPAPLGDTLTHVSRRLTNGESKDEVFADLMADLNFDYGRMFVHLLRLAWDDASVRPLFSRLATRIASLQGLMQKNNSEVAYSRFMAMGVNALIIPTFLIVQWIIPGAREFMTQNPAGRLLVTLSFLSILVGLLMDRLLNNMEVDS